MLCKCHWIVLYTVHFTAFCLKGAVFSGHGVYHTAHWWSTWLCTWHINSINTTAVKQRRM